MLRYGDCIEVTIESAGFEGAAIAHHEGKAVFVEGAVPGDVVSARIIRSKKKHAEAVINTLISPSVLRVPPPCRCFGTCGGCKWQHVGYAAQCGFKEQQVRDSLERLGGFKNISVEKIIPSENIFFYRNKMEFSFGDSEWIPYGEFREGEPQGAAFVLGFHVPKRYDKLINIEECFLQSPQSNAILNFVRSYALKNSITPYSSGTESGFLRNLVIREGKQTGETMVNIVTLEDMPEIAEPLTAALTAEFPSITTVVNNINSRKSQVATGESEKIYHGSGVIHDMIGGKKFQISANSFFQTNTLQAEILYRVIKDFAALGKNDAVYDLYCGTGSIALSVADSCRRAIGIELVGSSIENAKVNARLNGISNCEFFEGDLKDLLTADTGWMKDSFPPDVIIIDPPRSGMHPAAVRKIGEMKIGRIVYVSCNPATLARDLALLTPYGYAIKKAQPVDMFPHTYHIECVVQLEYSASQLNS